jgi:hypothetical protein
MSVTMRNARIDLLSNARPDCIAAREVAMANAYTPKLSEARHLLPLLRMHLVAAAARYPLPNGIRLDLFPIVEDGLFGYELVPNRDAHTYLTIGCNACGEPSLRKTSYGAESAQTLRLVAVNGQLLSRGERAARYATQQRELQFPDWDAATESAMAQLIALFPERPRQPAVIAEDAHRALDAAISIAHSHLAAWNPNIHFYGLPDEAQQGFALKGGDGEHGELIYQRPDIWMLRWKTPSNAVYESWSVTLPKLDGGSPIRQDLAS